MDLSELDPPKGPSRLAESLLRILVGSSAQGPYIVGDLREEFRDTARKWGRLAASAWYWAQVLVFGLPIALRAWSRSGGTRIDSIIRDVVFCFRTLKRRPLFAAVAVGTLGLGIGASTAMYSVVHAVLRDDLPYRNPEQLASIWQSRPDPEEEVEESGGPWERGKLTYFQYRRLSEAGGPFQSIAAFNSSPGMILTGGEEPMRVSVGVASASLFSVLGLDPVLGRGFLPGEDAATPGQAANVTVLGYDFWRSRFAGDQDVLGRKLILDGRAFTVVGVLSPEFRLRSPGEPSGPGKEDLWVPIGQPGWRFGGLNDSAVDWEVLGRLASGVSFEQAEIRTRAVLAGVYEGPANRIRVVSRVDDEGLTLDPGLVLMTTATCVLLLIVFLNVAILFLGELHGRKQEIATRVALGAGRSRVFWQFLTEGGVLGLLGSCLGVITAVAFTKGLVALAPPIPRIDQLALDGPVLILATLFGFCGAIVFGTLPVLVAIRGPNPASASAAASRTNTGRSRGFQSTLVTGEVALTVVLLVSGGLLTRSLFRLMAVDTGFRTENVATVRVLLPNSDAEPDAFFALFQEMIRELESDTEIVRASAAGGLPFGAGMIGGDGLSLETPDSEVPERAFARRIHVLPGFFETLGIPLLVGRAFRESDGPVAPPVMVVSESFARRNWPNRSPVGETIGHWGEPRTVIGVVGDVRLEGLGIDHEPTFYVPLTQIARSEVDLVARTAGEPGRVLDRMRRSVWRVNGNLPVTRAATMASLVVDSATEERYRTLLVAAFAILSAMIAAGGVFAVTARSVARRRREIGVRLALGAEKTDVVGLIIRGGLGPGILGTALGLAGALAVSRVLSKFLFGIQAWDPSTYAAVALLILTICLGASFAPGRVAARVDPAEALRV